MTERIGEFFVRLDLLSFEQAEEIVAVQKNQPGKRFGEIAVELDFLRPEDLLTWDEYCKQGSCE